MGESTSVPGSPVVTVVALSMWGMRGISYDSDDTLKESAHISLDFMVHDVRKQSGMTVEMPYF